jgi:valyl-tRNA synthetase
MPFLTEEIWQKLYEVSGTLSAQRESIMIQPWPEVHSQFINHKIEQKLNTVFQVITAIRNMRQELEIPLEKEIDVICATPKKENKETLEIMSVNIKNLTKAGNLKVEAKYSPMKSSITEVINDIHITIPLEGVIDIEKEKIKVNQRLQKIDSEIKIKQRSLSNSQFLEKAPPEVIEKERERLKELKDTLVRFKAIKNELS